MIEQVFGRVGGVDASVTPVRLRWPAQPPGEDLGQLALFDSPERIVGRGEYRGLEFVHVEARRVINRLRSPTPLPFRFTLNAYRGCSHACTYCFARPTHAYLGLDPGRDFDRVIVVKVNAVDALRAELAPKRWAGDSVAMGTNTDPYQAAEGKYRLTQGLVRVLSEARNPFSLLTKSTLVLRDLELLAEASQRTTVECAMSVGTLDDDVWRLTEPGTPRPAQRLEAVARLNEAGVACNVLVAPVLPGLSDSRAQLEAVTRAAVAAGAPSVSAVLLHLRPGVREHYLGSLAEHRPDLVARHERMYAHGPYAARSERARVSAVVTDLGARPAPDRRGTGPRPGRFGPRNLRG
jgi:DNA repair photolyase